MDKNTIRTGAAISLKPNANIDRIQLQIRPNLKQAIQFLDEAWSSVTEETIANCWLHTGILPIELNGEVLARQKTGEQKSIDDLNKLLEVLKGYGEIVAETATDMTAEEYLEVDTGLSAFSVPSESEIIDQVLVDEGLME